ncbi:hypothetical protein HEK616_28160 [Streptomyces nigrescens]|uniref:PASTA domain-containing protein n=1 Tax=Streptomyces nigrescens TaxID=1920 RepID=A0ABM7ZSG9_STRNI|nr:DUF3761 domain-containing protein [Streptomyces nigrescens]BDM69329.1 hypothetical protein HEK616_28160 [Streptomyces nigrescens]
MARNQRPQPTAEDKKNVRVGCGIMLAALLAVGGCGALINDDNASSSKVSSPTAASPDTSSSSASSSLSTFDDKPNTVTVDDFVGMGLQAAQDAAQDDGLYRLDSTDATGQGRQQVWDRNWTVCAQTPAAGETMSADDTLTFDTVKSSEGETCDDPTGSAGSEDSSTSGTGDSSTVAGTGDDYGDDGSATVAGTGDDQTDGSSDSGSSSLTGGSYSSGDESSSSASSAGSPQAPAGATAQCNDGSYSYSAHRRGTCSHHRGVAVWLASVPS